MSYIVFLGDSYTFGEGLELFIENDKWIKQRELRSEWPELQPIQDEDSIKFRENNRFAKIVSDYFECEPIIDPLNGVHLGDNLELLKKSEEEVGIENIKAIVVQFSCVLRNPIHLNRYCRCSLCRKYSANPISLFLNDVTKRDNYINRDWTKKIMSSFGKNEVDAEMMKWAFHFGNYLQKYTLDLFTLELQRYEDYGIPILTIDTWDEMDVYTRNNQWITDRLVKLKDNQGNYHTNWLDFQKTFGKWGSIHRTFPKTMNGHPTPIVHQKVAESLIENLKEKYET